MRKITFSFALSLTLLLSIVSLFPAVAQPNPVHNLDTALDYTTIQAAIDAPETLNGHTIQVDPGTYYENVVVNKPIYLIGENSSNTIIDGTGVGAVLTVTANNVTISNFTMRNSSISSDYYGLALNGCNNTTVQNCKITQNYMGLTVSDSSNNLFRNNTMFGNTYNVVVFGQEFIDYFIQDMDTSNKVEGNPIYYWIDHENEQVPSDAGFVALVNCTNVTVKNLDLKNNFNGISIAYSRNNTIQNNNITNNYGGIGIYYDSYFNQILENTIKTNGNGIFGYGWTYRPSHNSYVGNIISENGWGMYLWRTFSNNIQGNDIIANQQGIHFWSTYNSTVYENNIQDNDYGIVFDDSVRYNQIYHNNLVNNDIMISGASGLNTQNNTWDEGYPSGGNYWSNYNGTDNDGDGIGDTPYVIDENNQDNYPLVIQVGIAEYDFNATVDDVTYPVAISSNSSVSEFNFNETLKQLSFNVTGSTGTTTFCKISIPDDLLWGDFFVYINGELLVEDVDFTTTYNGTHNIFHITYSHSTHKIEIIGTELVPEFSSWLIPVVLLIATSVIVIFKKKLLRQSSQ